MAAAVWVFLRRHYTSSSMGVSNLRILPYCDAKSCAQTMLAPSIPNGGPFHDLISGGANIQRDPSIAVPEDRGVRPTRHSAYQARHEHVVIRQAVRRFCSLGVDACRRGLWDVQRPAVVLFRFLPAAGGRDHARRWRHCFVRPLWGFQEAASRSHDLDRICLGALLVQQYASPVQRRISPSYHCLVS